MSVPEAEGWSCVLAVRRWGYCKVGCEGVLILRAGVYLGCAMFWDGEKNIVADHAD